MGYFPRLRFAYACLRSLRLPLEHAERISPSERFTVILLSYKRPWNMDLLVRISLAVPFTERVIVSNNHPAVRIRDWIRTRDPRLTIVDQPEEESTTMRWKIARDIGASWFLVIDDDIFVPPRALGALCRALLRSPGVPHGLFGEWYDSATGALLHGIAGRDGAMDIMNRVYACSREHVTRFFVLAAECGLTSTAWRENHWDDLLLSFAGGDKPVVHALPYIDCPTQDDPQIAVWKQPGFFEKRLAFFHHLQSHVLLRAVPPFLQAVSTGSAVAVEAST